MAMEGRVVRVGRLEDDEEGLAQSFHRNLLYGNFHQEVWRLISHEGLGCLLLEDIFTKTGRTTAYVLREKHRDMSVPPVVDPW